MVFQIVPEVNLVQVDKLSETVRGAGGFGHTGTK
jgi:dUTP pyrophosphatase